MFNFARAFRLHRRVIMGHAATAVILALASACTNFLPSHIHDAAAERTAVDLQTKVAQYREDQSGLYESMAANLARFHVEEDKLINRIAANYTTALVTKAPDFTWNNLIENLDRVDGREKALGTQITTKLTKDLEECNVATADTISFALSSGPAKCTAG